MDVGAATGILEVCCVVCTYTLVNLIVTVIFIAIIVFIMYYFIEPLSANNVDYCFLTDYKEIVENIIQKRKTRNI